MTRKVLVALLIGCLGCLAADREGWVGITVSGDDFTVISAVVPDSPAAHAGVQAADRVVKVNGHPTAGLKKDEFIQLVSGPPQSDLELDLLRADHADTLRVRLRRIVAPSPTPPHGFDPHQASGDTDTPNQAMKRIATD